MLTLWCILFVLWFISFMFNETDIAMFLSIIMIVVSLLLFVSCSSNNKLQDKTIAHKCKVINCPMRGYIFFRTVYEEDTDGYYYDLTHWMYPKLTPSQVEDYIWSQHERGNIP